MNTITQYINEIITNLNNEYTIPNGDNCTIISPKTDKIISVNHDGKNFVQLLLRTSNEEYYLAKFFKNNTVEFRFIPVSEVKISDHKYEY